jgi:hypothetical protein
MGKKKCITPSEVPVVLIGFNRPEFIIARVYELARMPIKKLYISLDGGNRENNDEMKKAIDWCTNELKDIELFEIYQHEKNLGLVDHVTSTIKNLLKRYSYLIVVEDDIVLAKNFFVNMVKGLDYQRETRKLGIVGGFSATNLSKFKSVENKWRESKYTVIWGWGCSAEVWDNYNPRLDEGSLDQKLNQSQTWADLSTFQQQVWKGRFRKTIVNPNFTWDIQLQYLSFTHDFINLYPRSTITRNTGYSDFRSTNTKNVKPNWMTLSEPDNRIVSAKKSFLITNKFHDVIDANLLISDTKIINWWKHKKNYRIPF